MVKMVLVWVSGVDNFNGRCLGFKAGIWADGERVCAIKRERGMHMLNHHEIRSSKLIFMTLLSMPAHDPTSIS